MRRILLAGLAVGVLGSLVGLAGCDMFFDHSNSNYSYCDRTGCFNCTPSGCTPATGGQCQNNWECAVGASCQNGACATAPTCNANTDCQSGMVCDSRSTCVAPASSGTCTANADCGRGSFCDVRAHACISSRTCSNNDCGPGWMCDSRQTCVPMDCTTDQMCQAACYCDVTLHRCVETAFCASDADCANLVNSQCDVARRTCVPKPVTTVGGGSCTQDTDCQTGEVCCNGTCKTARVVMPELTCTADGQCGGGVCRLDAFNEGLCHAACTTDANCGTGDSCQSGFCDKNATPPAPRCIFNLDCAANHTCINGVCHADCTADTDCTNPADFCDQGICQPDWRIVSECALDSDCPNAGQQCVNGQCRYRCMQNADCDLCPDGPMCVNGYCQKF